MKYKKTFKELKNTITGIGEGIYNKLSPNEEIEKEAQRRLNICDACEHITTNFPVRCKICGCVLAIKARQNQSKCPISKW